MARSTSRRGKILICVATGLTVALVYTNLTNISAWTRGGGSKSTSYVYEDDQSLMKKKQQLLHQQIENYKRGTGLLLNLHLTHHAGTTFCAAIGKSPDANGMVPPFACWKLESPYGKKNRTTPQLELPTEPWPHNETAKNIQLLRQRFGYHMVSWEWTKPLGYPAPPAKIAATDWEDPNLLSVIVMRHPLERLLTADSYLVNLVNKRPWTKQEKTTEEWWKFAKSRVTNNFALHWLVSSTDDIECCQGADTSQTHLKQAKDLVRRFSIVLDMACIDDGLQALGEILNITLGAYRSKKAHAPVRERIGNDEIYDYLEKRNRRDIELYEWSKGLSLVDCSSII